MSNSNITQTSTSYLRNCNRPGWLLLAATFACTTPALALSLTPISQGQLPSGEMISIVQLTLDPNESVPWHFHTGTALVTIVSGTLTEDEGCGTSPNIYTAGTAFSEVPGMVHRVFNYGAVPVVVTWVQRYPGCDPNAGTLYVLDGPRCEGKSGRSHLEKISPCDAERDD